MSKLREKIQHYNTGVRVAASYTPKFALDHMVLPSTDKDLNDTTIHRAELHIACDYRVTGMQWLKSGHAAARNAEDQLLATLYGDLIPDLLALRSALFAGDVETASTLLELVMHEVLP